MQFLILLYLEKYGKLNIEKISELLGCDINMIINDLSGLIFNPSFNPKGEIDKGIISANMDPEKKELKIQLK